MSRLSTQDLVVVATVIFIFAWTTQRWEGWPEYHFLQVEKPMTREARKEVDRVVFVDSEFGKSSAVPLSSKAKLAS
jgi:hypothetical protein